jgi:3-phenylpropionate/cinnamic acid dioxygenase small subunit
VPAGARANEQEAAPERPTAAPIANEKDELRHRVEELEAIVANLRSTKSSGKRTARLRRRERSKS